jgi:hypothetical protein
MKAAALLFLATLAAAEPEPALIVISASRINPAGCALMALATLTDARCDGIAAGVGDVDISEAIYDPETATCSATFEDVAAGRHLLFLVGPPPYPIIGELSFCWSEDLDGRDVQVTTDHHRIFEDGFEGGFIWSVVVGAEP